MVGIPSGYVQKQGSVAMLYISSNKTMHRSVLDGNSTSIVMCVVKSTITIKIPLHVHTCTCKYMYGYFDPHPGFRDQFGHMQKSH